MNIKDCTGTFHDPIRVKDASNLTAELIADHMKNGTDARGIPANVRIDKIHSGGMLFGSDYPCVIVSHPNPPQKYSSLMFIINGNVISIMYWGVSKANYDHNRKEQLTRDGKFRSLFVSDDAMALQAEQAWDADIYDVFESAFEG